MIFFKLMAVVIIFVATWYTIRFCIKAYDKAWGVVEHRPWMPESLQDVAPANRTPLV